MYYTGSIQTQLLTLIHLDRKPHSAALFVNLPKAFDSVHHELLLNKLRIVGFGHRRIKWFGNYFVDQTQCVYAEGHKSEALEIIKGVPQASILGPVLFSMSINDLGKDSSSVC